MRTHRRRWTLGWLRVVAIIAMATLLGLCQLQSVAAEKADNQVAWTPQLSPHGPVVVVVSIPAQRADVYRNGIRIGSAPVSTGRKGYETPLGVYPILEKQREHYSNLYDDAPMPFMQRLTWSGVALHAGNLPGYPASHGCIRLPGEFAESLFEVTSRGTVVVVTDAAQPSSMLAPLPLAGAGGAANASSDPWAAAAADEGPLSLLLSTRDRTLVVLRGGREVARTRVSLAPEALPAGTVAYVLLEGTLPHPSPVVPGQPARPWMSIPLDRAGGEAGKVDLSELAVRSRAQVPADFAARVYALLEPGTTLVITDEPVAAQAAPAMVLEAGEPLLER